MFQIFIVFSLLTVACLEAWIVESGHDQEYGHDHTAHLGEF